MRSFLEGMMSDVRYAGRQMVRAPMITLVTITILAVGIGVNSALFSFVDTLLFRPVPGIAKTDRLVELRRARPDREPMIDYASYTLLRDSRTSFDGIAASSGSRMIVTEIGGNNTEERVEFVSRDYYTTLNPVMALGRAPSVQPDDKSPASPEVVISYGLWKSAFGGTSDAIGRTIHLNDAPMIITGVMGRDFFGFGTIYAPLSALPLAYPGLVGTTHDPRKPRIAFIAARLSPGVSIDRARAELETVNKRFRPYSGRIDDILYPTVVNPLRLVSGQDISNVLGPIGFIGNATVFILLIAGANVSVLLLSRAISRRREIGIRLAMGAERRRIVRQLLTEGIILAALASMMGLMLLTWLSRGLQQLFFPTRAISFVPSWHTIVISLAFALLTGILFALAPALHATRVGVTEALKDGAGGTDRRSTRLQRTFVIAEVALSMALVCAAGIFADAALRATRRDQSYMTSPRIIAANLSVRSSRLITPERKQLAVEGMVSTIRAIPGVERATYVSRLPGNGSGSMANLLGAGYAGMNTGAKASDSLVMSTVSLSHSGAGLFSAIGVSLISGRDISDTDAAGTLRVAVVDELIARQRWPGRNPVGQTIGFQKWKSAYEKDTAMAVVTVIGVVPHITRGDRGGGLPVLYLSAAQFPDAEDATFIVTSRGKDARSLVPLVTPVLRTTDRQIPVGPVQTLAQVHRRNNSNIYNAGIIAGAAGFIALALACVGIYATISFGLSQRIREIGVRRALGADDRDVVYTFFQEGMRLALIGFAIGIPVALAAMKIGVAEKFGVQTLTTPSIATIMAVLLTICALASWLPARRAARIDALTALKQD